MIIGRVNTVVADVFSIIDGENQPVIDVEEEITIDLYGPDTTNVLNTHPVSIVHLGNGHYRIIFTPLFEGLYYCIIYHHIYFPAGKGGHYQIFKSDFSTIGAVVELIKDYTEGRWRIDHNANQMIFFKADNTTELARFNLYDSAGNPSVENVFERRKQ